MKKLTQEDFKFKSILGYRMSSRPTRSTGPNCLKNNQLVMKCKIHGSPELCCGPFRPLRDSPGQAARAELGLTHPLSLQCGPDGQCAPVATWGLQSRDLASACLSEALQQEKWSQELAAWRVVAGEHDRLMQGWRKAWVCTWPPGSFCR